jgi:hypothetical protein
LQKQLGRISNIEKKKEAAITDGIPYEIKKRVGPLAYKLILSSQLAKIHDVF